MCRCREREEERRRRDNDERRELTFPRTNIYRCFNPRTNEAGCVLIKQV